MRATCDSNRVCRRQRVLVVAVAVLMCITLASGRSPSWAAFMLLEEAADVSVVQGEAHLLRFEREIVRTSISNTSVADIVVVSPTELLVNGINPGMATLVVWDTDGWQTVVDLMVQIDTDRLRELLNEVVPSEWIDVYAADESIVLAGEVERSTTISKAGGIAEAFSDNVVNLLQVRKPRQIMLQVRFAEIDRSVSKDLGFDFITQDTQHTFGNFAGSVSGAQVFDTPQFARSGGSGEDVTLGSATDLLLELRRGTDITTMVEAMESEGFLRIIAEPTLMSLSGEEASFLAGGEFPIPVSQGASGGQNSITIQYREFGIRLSFTPTVTDAGTIKLELEPEVSELDFGAASVQVSGFSVPALVTRRAETTVEMADSESLVIGGLISQNVTKNYSQIPFLGDIPILGKLFSSEEFKKDETELLVIVTPHFVEPTVIPAFADRIPFTGREPFMWPEEPPYDDVHADAAREWLDPQSDLVHRTLDTVEQEQAVQSTLGRWGYNTHSDH